MRGAIYSRVSTEIQDYGKQTDELKDYAARNDIEVKYIFEEKVSGFKDDRTEFNVRLKDAQVAASQFKAQQIFTR